MLWKRSNDLKFGIEEVSPASFKPFGLFKALFKSKTIFQVIHGLHSILISVLMRKYLRDTWNFLSIACHLLEKYAIQKTASPMWYITFWDI